MLPRRERIPKKLFPDFSLGRVFSNEFFSIRVCEDKEAKYEFRASVVVSKKVAKTAVRRNLLRRRLYGLLKDYKAKFPNHSLVVVYARSPAIKAPFSTLRKVFEKMIFV